MADLSALINKLEAAAFGSLKLNEEVADAVGHKSVGTFIMNDPWGKGGPSTTHRAVPAFTTSIDAAMMLVPERGAQGLLWRLIAERKPLHSGPAWIVTVREHAQDGADAIAHTLPLGLCAAALRLTAANKASTK